MQDKWVQEAEVMRDEAKQNWQEESVFWNRGVVPAGWTKVPQPEEEPGSRRVGKPRDAVEAGEGVKWYTDGSGGER
eukprot:2228013-Lingulodinium_polyedra.AAC.1